MISERPSLRQRVGQWIAKGPVPVGEPAVSTKALTDMARQIGGDNTLATLGPGTPITPVNTAEGAPRRWDYTPGYNIAATPRN